MDIHTNTRSPLSFGALAAAGAVLVAASALSASEQRVDPAAPEAKMTRPSTAEIDNALAIEGLDVAARKLATRMTVAAEVNGTGPYRFVVDSGADTSVVGKRIAARLALPPGKPVVLNGITESRVVNRVLVDSLGVGSTTVSNLQLPVLSEGDLGADGMLGLDALVEQRLVLDFEKRTITVDDASRPAPKLDGEIVVTARRNRGQLILTNIGAGRTTLEAIVDTGSELTIGNLALRKKLLRRNPKSVQKIEVTGVTGATVELELAVIPVLKLGPVTFEQVPIAFADVPPFSVFGIDKEPALLLGTDLMGTFRKVSLDFRARKVRFQLRRCNAVSVRIASATFGSSRLSSDSNTPAACLR